MADKQIASTSKQSTSTAIKYLGALQHFETELEGDIEEAGQFPELCYQSIEEQIAEGHIAKWLSISDKTFEKLILVFGFDPTVVSSSISNSIVTKAISNLLLTSEAFRPDNAYTVAYFCGLHNDDSEKKLLAGMLAHMIGQLMSQLVVSGIVDISFFSESDAKIIAPTSTDEIDLDGFYNLFEKVTRQVPQGHTLYCILDHVSVYDKDGGEHGPCRSVVKKLVRLLKQPRNFVMRLLLSNLGPNSKTFIESVHASEQHVYIVV